MPRLKIAARDGKIEQSDLELQPSHVIDIYKMRRGQYKNVRIWCKINLGNGRRKDLYMTRMDNEPMGQDEVIDLFSSAKEEIYDWRSEYIAPDLGKEIDYGF